MDTAAIKAYMNRWLEENKQEFYAVADEIWANPELGLEEYRAFGLITGLLEEVRLPGGERPGRDAHRFRGHLRHRPPRHRHQRRV